MADGTDKNTRNAPGPFFNDLSCIDCGLCPELAPNVFKRDDEEGLSYVWRQPESADEIRAAHEAIEACPTESIGHSVQLAEK
ncbi:ferredoxin [Roseibacillus persicicus]|uniref:ferredoxin n=1 Tax=Roseibacillus persicicus TaxID=454148 RepID=UPI00398A672D